MIWYLGCSFFSSESIKDFLYKIHLENRSAIMSITFSIGLENDRSNKKLFLKVIIIQLTVY